MKNRKYRKSIEKIGFCPRPKILRKVLPKVLRCTAPTPGMGPEALRSTSRAVEVLPKVLLSTFSVLFQYFGHVFNKNRFQKLLSQYFRSAAGAAQYFRTCAWRRRDAGQYFGQYFWQYFRLGTKPYFSSTFSVFPIFHWILAL